MGFVSCPRVHGDDPIAQHLARTHGFRRKDCSNPVSGRPVAMPSSNMGWDVSDPNIARSRACTAVTGERVGRRVP